LSLKARKEEGVLTRAGFRPGPTRSGGSGPPRRPRLGRWAPVDTYIHTYIYIYIYILTHIYRE
jgi:hypothetical protein